MKKVAILNSNYVLVDDEDYEKVSQWKWYLDKDGYPMNHKGVRMHKLIMQGRELDHCNGNSLDNRKSNLRVTTHKDNTRNTKAHRDGISIYKGVSKQGNKWRAQVCIDGRRIHLGTFPKERYAAYAYDLNAKAVFGESARLNFTAV